MMVHDSNSGIYNENRSESEYNLRIKSIGFADGGDTL